MEVGKCYTHLSAEERAVLQVGLSQGLSLRSIGQQLGRSHTSLSREVRRALGTGAPEGSAYQAKVGAERYEESRKRCRRGRKLEEGTALHQTVKDRLLIDGWSPEQIANRLKLQEGGEVSERTVSHETIYATIYAQPRGELRELMIAELRQRKRQRGIRRRTKAGGPVSVPETQRIAQRPAEVGLREVPGHWEGDLIKGAFNRSSVGTLVERQTRFTILCRMEGGTAQAALEGFGKQMKRLPAFLRESLTYDRGSEMALHEVLSAELDLAIWFADPHSPWQRGTNENTNGLLRQYLPKGHDLSDLTQTALNDVARKLNSRPRKTLGWRTPEEAMAELMGKFGKEHRAGAALPGGYSKEAPLKPWRFARPERSETPCGGKGS
jgi:IS30 family transposase